MLNTGKMSEREFAERLFRAITGSVLGTPCENPFDLVIEKTEQDNEDDKEEVQDE